MGQNDIENQIREKFNAREINPSAQAWDRLDAMLSVAEEKKTRRSFGWLYIAASILVFATVGTFLYNQQGPKTTGIENSVVDGNTEKESASKPDTTTSEANPTVLPQTISGQQVRVAQTNHPAKGNTTGHPVGSVQDKENKINEKPAVHPQGIKSQEAVAQNPPKKEEPGLSSPKIAASNADVAVAQNETASSKVKVNANSLLSEVDGELELTFREKVFKKVSKNYKEVKVALANRNLDQ